MTAAFMRTIWTVTTPATHCRCVSPPSRPFMMRPLSKRTKCTEQLKQVAIGCMGKHDSYVHVLLHSRLCRAERIVRQGSALVRAPPPVFFLIAIPWQPGDAPVSRLHQRLLLPMRGQCEDINFPCYVLSPPPLLALCPLLSSISAL